jgi:molybdopterin synthase catalytic subunit
MRVRVLLFGQLKDVVGKSEELLELGPEANVRSLLAEYRERFPSLSGLMGSIACAVNQEYAQPTQALREGDEVGLLPPVSGGKEAPVKSSELRSAHCVIVHEAIDVGAVRSRLADPTDGAAVLFEGVVRNNTRGRRTLYLVYEAYGQMALNEMERLIQVSLEQFKIRDAAIVHRLGRLEIGETSVAIGVASAHRAAAFEACRWLIDSLKKTVPIWKKEHFEDGAVWADGEPFPEEIRLNQ